MLRYFNWVTLVLGLWLIATPYVYGFTAMVGATVNSVVAGLIQVIVSCFGLYYQYRGAGAGQQPSPQRA